MNPIRPELRDLLVREATVGEARRRRARRRRRIAVPAAFAIAVLVVFVVAISGPAKKLGPGFFGTQDAVAAVARAVSEQDQVLSWTRQVVVETRGAAGATSRQEASETRWTDLRTGNTYVVTTAGSGRALGGPEKSESWASQGRLWVATADSQGRRVVQELPASSESDPSYSTVADVREILRRADRGELAVATERLGSSDVAVVTLRRSGGVSVQLWISRSGPPRVLRVRSSVECQRQACRGRLSTQTSTTTGWRLAPRTASELQRFTPPNARPRSPGR